MDKKEFIKEITADIVESIEKLPEDVKGQYYSYPSQIVANISSGHLKDSIGQSFHHRIINFIFENHVKSRYDLDKEIEDEIDNLIRYSEQQQEIARARIHNCNCDFCALKRAHLGG